MVLVKPNFLPTFIMDIKDDKYLVRIFKQEIWVTMENIYLPKIRIHMEGDPILYFDPKTQVLHLCTVVSSDVKTQMYIIKFDEESKRENMEISFHSVLLKAIMDPNHKEYSTPD